MTTISDAALHLWPQALDLIRKRVATPIFHSWFEIITPAQLTSSQLLLHVPSRFAKDWIEPRYSPLIAGAVSAAAGRHVEVILEVNPTSTDTSALPAAPPATRPAPSPATTPPLNLRFTFESFVIGASNRFSHAAALAVAEAPARAYNPLFIYGGVGLGKTHLLHAIGQYILATQSHSNICYVSTEKFTNDFIAAVGDSGRIAGFKRRYRENDVLLVDDIQFLERKEATMEEFFHTFNTLYEAGRQIVLTSDRAPKQLGLEERVRSRFAWGLITDVQPPDLETRIAIIRKKAQFEGFGHLPHDVMAFIASRVESNIRELEGALIRVIAFASLDHTQVSVALAEAVLKDLYPDESTSNVTSEVILAETARYFSLPADDLLSPARTRALVNARQIAMYLCRELTDLSLPRIGERFGGRDHTTVMHATSKIRGLMAEHRATYNQVQELTARIRTRSKTL